MDLNQLVLVFCVTTSRHGVFIYFAGSSGDVEILPIDPVEIVKISLIQFFTLFPGRASSLVGVKSVTSTDCHSPTV